MHAMQPRASTVQQREPWKDSLQFGTDRALRRRFFCSASLAHPAKMNLHLLLWLIDRYTLPGDSILDPMGGIGSTLLALLIQRNVILYDVERQWLTLAYENARRIQQAAGWFVGHATIRRLNARGVWPDHADHIVCSPPYGCAMRTTPTARRILPAGQVRRCSRRWLRMLSHSTCGTAAAFNFHYGRSAGQMGHFRGARYWQAMEQVYRQAYVALRPEGKLMLVIKDHVRAGIHVQTANTTVALCTQIGFVAVERHRRRVWPLSLWQRRRKEHGQPIIEVEDILVFQRPPVWQ